MTKLTVEIPEEIEHRSKMNIAQLAVLASRFIQEKIIEIEEIEHFKRSVAKSKLTEEDVEEISDKINRAMWEYHKKKYNP